MPANATSQKDDLSRLVAGVLTVQICSTANYLIVLEFHHWWKSDNRLILIILQFFNLLILNVNQIWITPPAHDQKHPQNQTAETQALPSDRWLSVPDPYPA